MVHITCDLIVDSISGALHFIVSCLLDKANILPAEMLEIINISEWVFILFLHAVFNLHLTNVYGFSRILWKCKCYKIAVHKSSSQMAWNFRKGWILFVFIKFCSCMTPSSEYNRYLINGPYHYTVCLMGYIWLLSECNFITQSIWKPMVTRLQLITSLHCSADPTMCIHFSIHNNIKFNWNSVVFCGLCMNSNSENHIYNVCH